VDDIFEGAARVGQPGGHGLRRFVVDLWHSGFAALGEFGDYLVIGASIVIPLFIILRLFNYNR